MQEDPDIKISMLLDDELASEEALKIFNRIRNESALRAKWIRYHIISCACKEKSSIMTDAGFFDRVSKALEQEPTVIAPKLNTARKLSKIPVFSLALAASVALVSVILWSGIVGLPENAPTNVTNGDRLALSNPALNSSPPIKTSARLQPARLPAQKQILPKRFNDYLITHNESTYTSGAQTMMPYARVISYSNNQ